MSKGSKPRPMYVNPREYEANWERIFGKKDTTYENDNPTESTVSMWEHQCNIGGHIMVGDGEHCNWCGKDVNGVLD